MFFFFICTHSGREAAAGHAQAPKDRKRVTFQLPPVRMITRRRRCKGQERVVAELVVKGHLAEQAALGRPSAAFPTRLPR